MSQRDLSVIGMGPPKRRRSAAAVVVIVVALVVAAALVGGAYLYGTRTAEETNLLAPPTVTSIKKPTLANAPLGSLVADVESWTTDSLILTVRSSSAEKDEDLQRVLEHLGFNAAAVMGRIGKTRALDGTQSAEGRYAKVYWTYHPDNGLGLVFEAIR